MATLSQRLESQFYMASWHIPLSGLMYGMGGALYASYVKLPLEKAVIAYATWGIAQSIFENLAMLFTDNMQRRTMLSVGVQSIACIVGVVKLTQMRLMGNICALAVAILYTACNLNRLKQNHII